MVCADNLFGLFKNWFTLSVRILEIWMHARSTESCYANFLVI